MYLPRSSLHNALPTRCVSAVVRVPDRSSGLRCSREGAGQFRCADLRAEVRIESTAGEAAVAQTDSSGLAALETRMR